MKRHRLLAVLLAAAMPPLAAYANPWSERVIAEHVDQSRIAGRLDFWAGGDAQEVRKADRQADGTTPRHAQATAAKDLAPSGWPAS